jgi:hypothetical protein
MATTAQDRTPVHLWIVGGLALLWNCFGAYDYLMTRTHNMAYIANSMPGVDPNAALAWVESMPVYSQIGWGLGVWGGLLGSVLMLMRSRYALWAFAASMLGILLSLGYQIVAAPPLAGADGMMYRLMPYVIIVIGAALLFYAQAMAKRGVLR